MAALVAYSNIGNFNLISYFASCVMYLEFMNWNLWRYNLKKHYQYVLVTTVTQNENMEEFCFFVIKLSLG